MSNQDGGKKKPTKKSDTKKPRKLNPFMKFCKEKRPEIKKKHPNLSVPETGKKLGEMWRALSNAEKKKYQ